MSKKKKTKKAAQVPTYKNWKELPHIPVSQPMKGSIGATGDWRTFKPVIDKEKCNKCGICYVFCPDGVILFKEGAVPDIDYVYCKGCGICSKVCPRNSLEMVRERQ